MPVLAHKTYQQAWAREEAMPPTQAIQMRSTKDTNASGCGSRVRGVKKKVRRANVGFILVKQMAYRLTMGNPDIWLAPPWSPPSPFDTRDSPTRLRIGVIQNSIAAIHRQRNHGPT